MCSVSIKQQNLTAQLKLMKNYKYIIRNYIIMSYYHHGVKLQP